jgi:hypothetical protein
MVYLAFDKIREVTGTNQTAPQVDGNQLHAFLFHAMFILLFFLEKKSGGAFSCLAS